VKSNPKQPNYKKCEAPKKTIIKSKIKGGDQEMTVMLAANKSNSGAVGAKF